eukprot:366455-Chlamydomonas_euryale.AAC.2
MAELDVQHVYNKRVFVNLLWESGTLALSKQLSENIFELQKSNSILQKMLGATEKRLCAVELLRRKDPSEELARMRAYKDTDAHLVEECVSSAVAAVLDDAVIVHATEYIFKGWIGDLDGMVVGGWRGQEVVVLVEAKHNMDACALKARTELLSAGAYWKELAKMEGSDDESVLSDYAQLHMEKFKHRSIMYAFGGSKFSDAVADHKLHGIPKPWFQGGFQYERVNNETYTASCSISVNARVYSLGSLKKLAAPCPRPDEQARHTDEHPPRDSYEREQLHLLISSVVSTCVLNRKSASSCQPLSHSRPIFTSKALLLGAGGSPQPVHVA